MLTELSIENFAIIDSLLLRLEPGFTALTGETGAGKSIIVDALQAALGVRTSSDVVREGARLAVVETVFELPERIDNVTASLEALGIEDEGTVILRREISAAGRGVARINGRAVPLSAVAGIASSLVDIHGQSEHLSVLRHDRQLEVLDRLGGLEELRNRVGTAIRDMRTARAELHGVESRGREMAQHLDLLRFQVGEIDAAGVQPGEEEELLAERTLLSNAEKLTTLASAAYGELQGDAGSAADRAGEALAAVHDLAAIDPALSGLHERLTGVQVELEDIGQELRRYRDAVEYDPRRLEVIEERLDLLLRLKRKYGPSLEEVAAFGETARRDLEQVENMDVYLEELTHRVREAERVAGALAEELSGARLATAEALKREMTGALSGLGLKNTAFDVLLDRTAVPDGIPLPAGGTYAFTASGIDTVTFLVSFNPGEPLRPLDRVASGGETSRFLLALKSVLASADRTPTLIFDEVDTGVGGRSGAVVGERLRELSRNHQVLSITHLPQIAALAEHHLIVTKRVGEGRTGVQVRQVEAGERVLELAEMMSGTGSEAALRSARELLEAAGRPA